MKICFVASTYPRSESDPAVPWLRQDVNLLKARGFDVSVFAPSYKGLKSHTIDGIPVHRFRYWFAGREDLTHDEGAPNKIRRPDYLALTLFYILAGAMGLASHHGKKKFDIIHVHWPFPHAMMALYAMMFNPAKLVMSFHGAELLLSKKFKFVDPMLKKFTKKADAVTCNSSYTAGEIRKLGTVEPIVLPYGSPVPFREATLPTNKVKNVLFVGRLIERKGIEYLIDAMPLVRKDIPDATFTIVGNGALLQSLKDRVAAAGLSDAVLFRQDVSEEELIERYSVTDLFVLPAIVDSRGDTEGLGVVLIEALSFKRPVIASAVGGIVDVIIDEQTGLLVEQKNPSQLATAIVRVLNDPALAKRLGEQGLEHVRQFFDWDVIMDKTSALYAEVMVSKKPVESIPLFTDKEETTTTAS